MAKEHYGLFKLHDFSCHITVCGKMNSNSDGVRLSLSMSHNTGYDASRQLKIGDETLHLFVSHICQLKIGNDDFVGKSGVFQGNRPQRRVGSTNTFLFMITGI